jgi:hypothetical protein
MNYESAKGIEIKGISNSLLRTEGTAIIKLFASTHETTHLFLIMGNEFSCQYDGILGRDFWRNNGATINYCDGTISVGEVKLNFVDKITDTTSKTHTLTLKTRTESIVRLPTKSVGLGIITKKEIIPGVYLPESLTEEINGYCVTSIVNTLERDITIDPPHVELEKLEDENNAAVYLFSNSRFETDDII